METSSSARRSFASLLLLVLGGCVFAQRPASTLTVGRGPGLAFSPSGDFVATSGEQAPTSGETLRVWRVSDGQQALLAPCPYPVTALAFSRDAHWIAGTVEDGSRTTRRVLVWSVPERAIDTRLLYQSGRSAVNGTIAYTPAGDMVTVVTSGTASTVLEIWSKNGDAIARPLGPHPGLHADDPGEFRADLAADASVVAIGRNDRAGAVELWDVESGRLLRTLDTHVRATAFAVSSECVAAATSSNLVRVYPRRGDGAPVELAGDWSEGQDTLWALAFSPDGDLVAGGGIAGEIHVWSLSERRIVETLRTKGVICALAFSPRGDVLASSSWDGRVQIWRIGER